MKLRLPTYISVKAVREILGPEEWDQQRTRRFLKREGAVVKRGGRYYATRRKLREAFPEIWDDLVERIFEGE